MTNLPPRAGVPERIANFLSASADFLAVSLAIAAVAVWGIVL